MNETIIDMSTSPLRQVNQQLHSHNGHAEATGSYRIQHPQGAHALACGLDAQLSVTIEGHVGYYCAGMNKKADIEVCGNVGQGVAENMMSGVVHVRGDASQSAGATAHGGLLIIEGNAAARCGISLKGADIVVKGNVGHMSMFMAQLGTLVVLGNAGDALGDSLYEADIFVGGQVNSLGTDCEEKEMTADKRDILASLLARSSCAHLDTSTFRCFGSARRLYNFDVDNLDVY